MLARITSRLAQVALGLAIFAVGEGHLMIAHAKDSSPATEAARLATFKSADDLTYFVLSLSIPGATIPAPAHDLVVLVDTSASQNGPFREKSLAVVRSLTGALGEQDRVRLFAVDIDPVALHEGFVSPGSEELTKAVAALEARVPLGATDLVAALEAALASFEGKPSAPRAVLYVGDGMSAANVLTPADFQPIVQQFVAHHVPVTNFAIGPRTDNHTLAALANQTGGLLSIDSDEASAEETARHLLDATRAVVLWPKVDVLPGALADSYPRPIPPLRSDRDTIVFGVGNLAAETDLSLAVGDGRTTRTLTWHVAGKPSEDAGFLPRLVELARRDGGLTMPTLGSAGLAETARLLQQTAKDLTRLGNQAVATGNVAQAKLLADEARHIDPQSEEAAILSRAVEKAQEGSPGEDTLRLVADQNPAAAEPGSSLAEAQATDGEFLSDIERRNRVFAGYMQTEVQNAINQARQMMNESPDSAINMLKLAMERVKSAAELDPALRGQLERQLEAALREGARRSTIKLQADIQRQESAAVAEERRRVNADLFLRQQKVEQLIARFDSLMDEGRFRDAHAVASIAAEIDPKGVTPVVAVNFAGMVGAAQEALELRLRRQVGIVDALGAVERSHVPIADEPPIIYPDPEVWELLSQRRKKFASVDLSSQSPTEERIQKALDEPTTIEFVDTELSTVLRFLEDLHKIQIVIDNRALEDAGASSDTLITQDLRDIKLRSALRIMLRDHDLTWLIDDEVLMITSNDRASERLSTKVYPVADLVVPIQSNAGGGAGGGFGFGGSGVGGGMGGGMGGMGGGGFGGGGGGFGGGGMGGGFGGGQFNVPAGRNVGSGNGRNLFPFGIPQGGFQAFAVKDNLEKAPARDAAPAELKLTAEPAPQPAKPAAPAAAPVNEPVEPIKLDIPAGADVEQAWNDYFASHTPDEAVVRETVRRLKKAKQYQQVIGLVKGALRNQQPQPWMYEVLGIALVAEGRSRNEVERSLMSALDFANDGLDALYVAAFMAQNGFEARALKLYRQISKLDPSRPEPLALGLALAEKLDDVPALQWSTAGILSQAWPSEQAAIWDRAYRVAEATLARLKDEQRVDEAARFKAELDRAVSRDCVAVVTWTGDADIDILVEEPAGTVCSSRNPRTTSGGVMAGDHYPRGGEESSEAYSESYSCPQAFNGKYRVLVRRVWGKPTAGKVTVDLYVNYGTDKAEHQRKQIPLGEEDALVTFDVKEGRRTEPLTDQQVVLAARQQMAVGREVLAQQLNQQINQQTDLSSLGSLGSSRQRAFVNGFNPVLGGAVGYQPVIVTLPEGVQLVASAVISADRRYVRFNGTPFFSGVGEVNTFNFVTGQSGTSNGGTGGQGFGGGGGAGGFGGGGGQF
ncbi:MAG: hypothetical protein KF708_23925 [Pirellulales bacterium]|nr:hypothetical protein [Pirellulales bacterium]